MMMGVKGFSLSVETLKVLTRVAALLQYSSQHLLLRGGLQLLDGPSVDDFSHRPGRHRLPLITSQDCEESSRGAVCARPGQQPVPEGPVMSSTNGTPGPQQESSGMFLWPIYGPYARPGCAGCLSCAAAHTPETASACRT